MPGSEAVRLTTGGIAVRVRVSPRAGREEISGLMKLGDGRSAVSLKVRAAPVAGAANAQVERAIARALGVPASAVRVTSGRTAKIKSVAVSGDGTVLAAAALSRLGGE